jgi:hypothetical protein
LSRFAGEPAGALDAYVFGNIGSDGGNGSGNGFGCNLSRALGVIFSPLYGRRDRFIDKEGSRSGKTYGVGHMARQVLWAAEEL